MTLSIDTRTYFYPAGTYVQASSDRYLFIWSIFSEKLVQWPIVLTPLFMGAESCEKSESLQTFFATFLMYALYGSKKLRKKFGNFYYFRQ